LVLGILGLLLTGCRCSAAYSAGSGQGQDKSVYLFSYFLDNGQDGLHLACSTNGLEWKVLGGGKSYLAPTIGGKLMRDPCVLRGADGLFHMVWTTGWWDKGIGYASSKDLINWSEQKFIPVMEHEPTAKNCWAPEVAYDPNTKDYMIFWATTIPGKFPETESSGDNNHRMYYVTTKDFQTFSTAKVLLDPGFNSIDATIIRADGHYVMFIKNESKNPPEENIRVCTADKLIGPWGAASKPITGKYWAEGPTAVQVGDWWYVYFDKYTEHKYGALRSKDLTAWEDVSEQLRYPKGLRHGTAFAVEPAVLKNLLSVEKTQQP
jgi:beta-galactosidase